MMSAPNPPEPPVFEPALLRGLTQRRPAGGALGRRDLLRAGGLAALGMGLAACGVKGKGVKAGASVAPDAIARYWAGKTRHGHVDFANWPLYMDPKRPELKKYQAETGTTVTYKEVIEEMGPWFAKVQPQLSAGQSIGYDLMVITNGVQFNQFVQSGFLAPLDHARMPNFARNAGEKYKNELFDTGNVHSVPWVSGVTGIAYDPARTGRPITKLADLWDTRFKGKVGMFSDSQELGNFGLLALGVDPARSTPDDWKRAADHLKEQKNAGLVRNYYDQSYIDALGKGEVWITQAWSGDVFQKNLSDGRNFQFVVPEEGGTIWTDNMTIPITARNPVDAIELMDFFYRPDVAASLTEYINYVTPVPAAQQQILADAAKKTGAGRTALEDLAKSPNVFPSDAVLAKLHYYVSFPSVAVQQQYDKLFEPITLS